MILKQTRRRKYSGKKVGDKIYTFVNYVPRVNISQREDNLKLLQFAQERYGGYVMENCSFKQPYHRVFYWTIQNRKSCELVARYVMESNLPHHKKKAAKIVYDFCHETDPDKYHIYYDQIRQANKFQGVT